MQKLAEVAIFRIQADYEVQDHLLWALEQGDETLRQELIALNLTNDWSPFDLAGLSFYEVRYYLKGLQNG